MARPEDLPDRYPVLQLLGEGDAGRVWLVEDRHRPAVRLALKQLVAADRARAESLRLEFATLTGLRHPGLVELHDLDVAPGGELPFFTMEYVQGEDLVTAVRREGAGLFLDLAAEALRALSFLHDFGFVHRDLKPGNLLVRRRPRLGCRLVVLDFGLAMRGELGEKLRTTVGTLPYIAPELFDRGPPGPATDLYALGAVLFEAIHGRPAFRPTGEDLARFVETVRAGRRTRPQVPEGFPADLGGWLEDLLSPDPSQRPAAASEALARLNDVCGTDYPAGTAADRAARLASGAPPGRETEIEKLGEHLAPSERPRLVWLCGTAGSGKKRLLRWLVCDAVAHGWEVVVSPPELGPESAALNEGAVAALVERLRRRAAECPTLVLLQRVESAGSRTAEFLERIAREGEAAPLRVVAGLRPAEVRLPALRRLIEQTGRVPTLRRVDLEPFDARGLRAMVERATGGRSISRTRLSWLARASEGDPMTAEALIVEGAWERRGPKRSTIHSASVRLGGLSADGARLVEALSVLRGESRAGLAARLAELELERAREVMAELTSFGLARECDDLWSIESMRLAEGVVERMDRRVSAAMHRRAAMLFEEQPSSAESVPFRVARLWSAAGEPSRAVSRALRAAEQASVGGDPLLAAERYAFALLHLPRRHPSRVELRLEQAAALRRADYPHAAARAFAAAVRLAGSERQRAEILADQASMLVQAGRFRRGRAVAEQALDLARRGGLPAVEARANEVIGTSLARQGDDRRASPYLTTAVAEYERAGESEAQAQALQALAVCEVNEGLPSAKRHFARATELFQRLGARGRGSISRVGLAVIEQRAGCLEKARALLGETRRIAAENHNLAMEGIACCTLAQNGVFHGSLAEALALGRKGEVLALHLGDDRLRFAARGVQAQALARCGRTSQAAALVESTLGLPHDEVDPVTVEGVRLALAEARMASAQPDESLVESSVRGSLEGARRWRDPDTLLWALVLELERRARPGVDEPLEPVREELDELNRRGGSWAQPLQVLRADLAAAQRALVDDDLEQAERRAREVALAAERLDQPALGAHAGVILADALERMGDQARAGEAEETGRRQLEQARLRIDDPELARGFAERPVFRRLRQPAGLATSSINRKLVALYDMIRTLNSVTDPDALLESILDMALEVVRADRGMILLRDAGSGEFSICLSRRLERETAEDAEAFSRHIVVEAGAGKSVLAIDAQTDERFRDLRSVSLHGIRSLMCVPLRSRGRIVGTVYLDSRRLGRLFTRENLRFLEAFADHAALALENARAQARLLEDNRRLQAAAEARVQFGNLVGGSESMGRVFELIDKVADSDLPVLIQGESGTGKELVARAIHFNGSRRKRAFVTENCAAIPDTLLQSELFGHVRGAFTGAERDRAGLFEQADGGTLFLDEVGDMSASMQAQLLRALQEGEIRRVGGERPVNVDVRVLAATHRDLAVEAEHGRFREDLMYRLQVLGIQIPPLRERAGDVPLLADHFLRRIAAERDRPLTSIEREVMELLEGYAWPGNVRQLESAIQRLSLLAGKGPITTQVLELDPGLKQMLTGETAAPREAPLSLDQSEREQIRQALLAAKGNRARAARMLGISRATIYRKLKDYRL
jgi:transcriptional regulator with GAF, ATPase, and Fis domain